MNYKYEAPILIEPLIHGDQRGYFFEPYNRETFRNKWNIDEDFVQDNESFSRRGVLRGLHYQMEPKAQAKLVRVVLGEVLDVVVDIRKGSQHFGKVYVYVLDDKKRDMLFIPRGFAHGFAVLSETAIFQYKVDNFYAKDSERGIHYADKRLAIDWQLPADSILVSDKDKVLPAFENAEYFD